LTCGKQVDEETLASCLREHAIIRKARRGQGDDDDVESNDDGYAILPPRGAKCAKRTNVEGRVGGTSSGPSRFVNAM
jgi:hypothetical protein